MRHLVLLILACLAWCDISRAADPPPQLAGDVLPLLKTHCVKCHGPAKREAELNLSTPRGLARGGENGAPVTLGNVDGSLLWQRVAADEMPPEEPLTAADKDLLKRWIAAGAPGLAPANPADDARSDHWAFDRLAPAAPPAVRDATALRTVVDHYIQAALEARGLTLNPPADRATMIRRVSFDLTGLPPTPAEITAYLADQSPESYERMVDRYLASPHYGERWGKYWLDAAGYADSNGYFNADTDRPLAYRYRDWVVRAINADKPIDRFVVEQLAGDELAGFTPGQDATPEIIELLEATHFLRNGQDGSGESDGNADEVRTDRYSALESTEQIVSSSLLGLTMQCAKCHDHKFEAISQRDYYQLQSVFFPAFNVDNWLKPNERFVYANLPGELAAWEAKREQIASRIAALRAEYIAWVRSHRLASTVMFHDEFDASGPPLAELWSATAPGDDAPAGTPAVTLDSPQAPGAVRQAGALRIVEGGGNGDRWLSTREAFEWAPAEKDQWIQVTFDLIDNKVDDGAPAERIAYCISLHDFNDNGAVDHGNILLDGNPAGGVAVHLDYPGEDSRPAGDLGTSKYEPGHNFGVRITNVGKGKFRLEHLVDLVPDEKPLQLKAEDLPPGGFGFEYCCGRSFVVDNVVIERSPTDAPPTSADRPAENTMAELEAKRSELAKGVKALEAQQGEKPGKISCVTDRTETPPEVFLLVRGNYTSPGDKVEPAPLSALGEPNAALRPARLPNGEAKSTGRRLAWAQWLTETDSRQAALFARVQVNRLWQHHFQRGLVATSENLGVSGAPPTHPELLDYLAAQLVHSGWSMKAMHRLLLGSAVYRQSSALVPEAFKADPDNRLLWRFPLVRLDAEALRDAMLAVSGQLDARFGGPYVPTTRDDGEVVVPANQPGALRRSLYLQQRRTQTLSLLNVFDAPTLVFNCLERGVSTMPLQSLSLMNSAFVVTQAQRFAERVAREAPALSGNADSPAARVQRAYLLALAREPQPAETATALEFVASQRALHAEQADAEERAWADFCQMLLASNAFLYVE